MIRITCTSCQKPLSLDETKLPAKEVTFPCPVCKTKLVVDRRTLGADGATAPVTQAPRVEEPDDDDDLGSKAFIVGADNPSIRHAAKLIGFVPIHFPTPEQARDRFMQEFPHVVLLNPAQMTPPPLEGMHPILTLAPIDRRRSFFILFSDNLRSLDGNAAFLYGVNLVVALKDIAAFPQIYKDAIAAHERFYAMMNAITRSGQPAPLV